MLYGRCDEEPLTSYQPFVQALRDLLDDRPRARARHELHAGAGRARPARARAARAGCRPTCRPRPASRSATCSSRPSSRCSRPRAAEPLLLVIDDLQWADESTLHLLRHVLDDPARAVDDGRRAPRAPRRCSRRRAHPLVAALDRVRRSVAGASASSALELEGLDDAETGALVGTREQQPVDAEFVRRLHEATAGNPFFIEETLRGLRERDTGGDPVAALSALGVPSGAREVIQRRLARLGPTRSSC